jgi:hypothetical protein
MSNLLSEIGLRLAKAAAALILGAIVFGLAVGPAGATPSVELALLSWLSGAAFILLVETSPI